MGFVEPHQHIDALVGDGELLAGAAERASLQAAVPTCPGWQVRDLLRHLGYVHRWARAHVAGAAKDMVDGRPEREILTSGPDDAALACWFRQGHAALVETLRSADPGLSCWTFLDAPSPLAFWARRQAHETAIHRADAERAAGSLTPFAPEFAADGIDELIMGFAPRRRRRTLPVAGRALQVRATDTGHEWLVTLGPEAVAVRRGRSPGDCMVAGGASDLYLLLWNRIDAAGSGAHISGDAEVLRLWQTGMRVRWQ